MDSTTRPPTAEPDDPANAAFAAAQRTLFDAYSLDVRERSVPIDDPQIPLRVYEVGPADDDVPVVFVHSTGAFGGFFTPLLSRLTGRRCVVLDRPGYGLSGPFNYTEANLRPTVVAAVHGVLDALDLDAVDLVGHSMGGQTVLLLARDHPERVRRVTTLGAIPAFPGTHPPLPIRLLQVPVLGRLLRRATGSGEAGVLDIAEIFGERETIQDHPALIRAMAANEANPRTAATGQSEFASLVSPFGWRSTNRLSAADLRSVPVPTTAVWGAHDPLGSPDHVTDALEAIPDVHLETVPAGHMPFLGHPERCAAVIRGDH